VHECGHDDRAHAFPRVLHEFQPVGKEVPSSSQLNINLSAVNVYGAMDYQPARVLSIHSTIYSSLIRLSTYLVLSFLIVMTAVNSSGSNNFLKRALTLFIFLK
jgi:hypothetical protein